jgi:outer membrane cobalamin receptor
MGYIQKLFGKINLFLTGYFKDVNDEIEHTKYQFNNGRSYSMYMNMTYRDIKGIETRVELLPWHFLRLIGILDYQ